VRREHVDRDQGSLFIVENVLLAKFISIPSHIVLEVERVYWYEGISKAEEVTCEEPHGYI
jgi:hypothetical protein